MKNASGSNTLWRVTLFGPFTFARVDGGPQRLRSRKAYELLAMLALRLGVPLRKAALAESLWPETPEKQQLQSLRQCLSSINQNMTGALISETGSALLSRERVSTDLDEFDDLLLQAKGQQADSRFELLQQALQLVRGPLLSDFDSDWTTAEQLRFEESYAGAASEVMNHLVGSGGAYAAIAVGKIALGLVPGREDVHVGLIRSYAAADLAAEAIKQFEALERLLEEEWGESPGDEACKAIRDLPQRKPWGPTAADRQFARRSETAIFGRNSEVEHFQRELYTDTTGGLWSLVGQGGVGKTTLARKILELAPAGQEGVFVELSDLRPRGPIIERIIESLPKELRQRDYSLEELSSLFDESTLLVLDNAEQILEDVCELAQKITTFNPNARILVTSRKPLGTRLERVFNLQNLLVPVQELGLAELALNPSAAVFLRRAVKVSHWFRLTSSNALAIIELCRRLDGSPLAIELAASQITHLSPAQILSQLELGNLQFNDTMVDSPVRHRSLENVVAWSYELLDEDEQRFLRALSVLRGSLSYATAVALVKTTNVDHLISSLIRSNVMEAVDSGHEVRYRLSLPVRSFGLRKLSEHSEEEATRQALNIFALELSEELRSGFDGADSKVAFLQTERELELFRNVVEHAEPGTLEFENAAMILGHLAVFCGSSNRSYEFEDHAWKIVEHGESTLSRRTFIIALYAFGLLSQIKEPNNRSFDILDRAVEVASEVGDPIMVAGAITARSFAQLRKPNDYQDASGDETVIELINLGLESVQGVTGQSFWRASAARMALTSNLAAMHRRLGRQSEAILNLKSCMESPDFESVSRMHGPILLGIADNMRDLGNVEEALRFAVQAEQLCLESGHTAVLSQSILSVGMCHFQLGNPQAACQAIARAAQLFADLNIPHRAGPIIQLAALVYCELGDRQAALCASEIAGKIGTSPSVWVKEDQKLLEKLPVPLVTTHATKAALQEAKTFLEEFAEKHGVPLEKSIARSDSQKEW